MKYTLTVALLVATSLWSLTPVRAQSQVWEPTQRTDIQRAIELEAESAVEVNFRDRWVHAADLLREASRLRPEGDPIALTNLQMAGIIYANSERLGAARATLLELTDRATAFGEVSAAANAWIDVAFVEAKLGSTSSARGSYERAQRLAMSSHLTSDDQRHIADRLSNEPTMTATRGR
jgi:hypothetical protein